MSESTGSDLATIYQRPVELLQNLIRFNTTNPPGNEKECIDYINQILNTSGIETTIIAKNPARPNLIARLTGANKSAPLLMYGHVDVVTTENQTWQQPPFAGNVVDGYIWGRGALDMKGGVAMMLAAFLRAKAEGSPLPGDVILTIVSDEEGGGVYGTKYLIEHYKALFDGVRYAIGELGGCTFHIGHRRFYPIMVAEKQPCMIVASVQGEGGYPSLAIHDGTMAKLGWILQRLEHCRTPMHVTSTVRQTINTVAEYSPFPANLMIRQLMTPRLSGGVLRLLGKKGAVFEPMLRNSVNATAIRGADNVFMLPERIVLTLACMLLPDYTPEDMIAELRQIIGEDIKLKVIHYDGVPTKIDMTLFDTLAKILKEADPQGIPVPILLPTTTDCRFFRRIGIQTYGFIPMNLPPDFNFWQTAHATNERIPVGALNFGVDAILKLLQRF